jgi:hypothetical protein
MTKNIETTISARVRMGKWADADAEAKRHIEESTSSVGYTLNDAIRMAEGAKLEAESEGGLEGLEVLMVEKAIEMLRLVKASASQRVACAREIVRRALVVGDEVVISTDSRRDRDAKAKVIAVNPGTKQALVSWWKSGRFSNRRCFVVAPLTYELATYETAAPADRITLTVYCDRENVMSASYLDAWWVDLMDTRTKHSVEKLRSEGK